GGEGAGGAGRGAAQEHGPRLRVRDVDGAGAAAGAGAQAGGQGRPAARRPGAARTVPGRGHEAAHRPRRGRLPGAGDGGEGAGVPQRRGRAHRGSGNDVTAPAAPAMIVVDRRVTVRSNKWVRWRIGTDDRSTGMADISDADLLARYRSGDESALEALFERY